MQKIIFDNKFRVKDFVYWLVYFTGFSVIVLILCYIQAISFGHPTENFQWVEFYQKDILILVLGVPLYISLFLYNEYRNRYRIIGDTLIIKEYMFFFKTIDVTIPLSTIDEVKLTRNFNRPPKHIQLRTGDAVYDLSCNTYRDELYKEIVSRIGQKQIAHKPQVKFYKQRNHG